MTKKYIWDKYRSNEWGIVKNSKGDFLYNECNNIVYGTLDKDRNKIAYNYIDCDICNNFGRGIIFTENLEDGIIEGIQIEVSMICLQCLKKFVKRLEEMMINDPPNKD